MNTDFTLNICTTVHSTLFYHFIQAYETPVPQWHGTDILDLRVAKWRFYTSRTGRIPVYNEYPTIRKNFQWNVLPEYHTLTCDTLIGLLPFAICWLEKTNVRSKAPCRSAEEVATLESSRDCSVPGTVGTGFSPLESVSPKALTPIAKSKSNSEKYWNTVFFISLV